jgi:hypothetical protein
MIVINIFVAMQIHNVKIKIMSYTYLHAIDLHGHTIGTFRKIIIHAQCTRPLIIKKLIFTYSVRKY